MNIAIINKLDELVKQNKITIPILHRITKVDEKNLRSLLKEKDDSILTLKQDNFLSDIAIMLADGMSGIIKDDERVKAVIDILIQNYDFNYKLLSCYCGLEEETISTFMDTPDSLSYEERYRLAVNIMMLHYLFKSYE